MLKEGNSMSRISSLQDPFLNALRKEKISISVYLVNGIKLGGYIEAFDQFSIVLKNNVNQMVYKHAISTIVPSKTVRFLYSNPNIQNKKSTNNEKVVDNIRHTENEDNSNSNSNSSHNSSVNVQENKEEVKKDEEEVKEEVKKDEEEVKEEVKKDEEENVINTQEAVVKETV